MEGPHASVSASQGASKAEGDAEVRAPAPLPVATPTEKPAAQATTGARLRGWLHKRGLNVKSWKLRWIILQRGCVYYYENPHSAKSRGFFSLQGYSVARAPDARWPSSFMLVPTNKGERTWYFMAANDNEMLEWMEAIRQEITKYFVTEGLARIMTMHSSLTASAAGNDDDDYDDPYDDSMGAAGKGRSRGSTRGSIVSPAKPVKPVVAEEESSDDDQNYDEPFDDSTDAEKARREEQRRQRLAAGSAPEAVATSPKAPPVRPSVGQSSAPPLPPRPAALVADPETSESPHLIPLTTDVEASPWFFWGQDRVEAEGLLSAGSHGQFLVRQKDAASHLVLSVKWGRAFKHYKLFFVEGSGFSVGGDCVVFFTNLVSLIRHYQTHPLPRSDNVVLGHAYSP